MKKVCLVPARGGSKRLPNKNIRELCGKPLIYHTLDAVRNYFDLVVVPTDSEEIYQKILDYQHEKVRALNRPAYLAADTSKILETVVWYFDNFLGRKFEQIWLCLPTCPLRSMRDVEKIQFLLKPELDSIVSVTDFEFPVKLSLSINNGLLEEVDDSKPFSSGDTRSQDHKKVYRPNGAFYGSWCRSFSTNRNFFKGRVAPYWMPRERSVDIDEEFDLKIAEALLCKNGK